MRRREFIAGLGGAAAWPLAARAQQPNRMRRVGVLLSGTEKDLVVQALWAASREALGKLGWIEGSNVRFDVRFITTDPDRMRAHAEELVRLAPDVILAVSLSATKAVQQQTRTIPIVFVNVGDPVAGGLVKSFARPQGNTTGITGLYPSITGKWLGLLKEAAPRTSRVALIFHPEFVAESFLPAIETVAAVLAVKTTRTPVRQATEIERAIVAFAAEPDGGLIMMSPTPTDVARESINRLTVQYRLPSISASKLAVVEGGLMSYGPPIFDAFRSGSSYVDRILSGAEPGDLPVQFPTKFELVINLKTAKAIGLTIPESFLLRADEVIE
jgi:putative tryptophan/tyrosine transport system substrate-binding protein